MSQHSEESDTIANSDSFWEPGNYKRTVKRTEDGFKLCNDLIALVQERAEAEKNYAKSLKSWSKKWNEIIEKGPEYGTMEAAWKAVLEEADRRCDMHMSVKDNLLDKVSNSIKQWQKDSYHKSMMTLKEKKEFEDSFKKVTLIPSPFLVPLYLFPIGRQMADCIHSITLYPLSSFEPLSMTRYFISCSLCLVITYLSLTRFIVLMNLFR